MLQFTTSHPESLDRTFNVILLPTNNNTYVIEEPPGTGTIRLRVVGERTLADALRNPCPKCGKPMVRMLHPGGKQSRVRKCLACDEIDPMTSPDVRSWIESAALRPLAETKKPE